MPCPQADKKLNTLYIKEEKFVVNEINKIKVKNRNLKRKENFLNKTNMEEMSEKKCNQLHKAQTNNKKNEKRETKNHMKYRKKI